MPISYRLDPGERLIVTTVTGRITDSDVLAHMKGLASDPGVDPGMVELCDMRELTELAVTSAGVKQFISFDRSNAGARGRLALVAAGDEAFGTARMYQMRTSGDRVGVFRTIEEARTWLGLAAS